MEQKKYTHKIIYKGFDAYLKCKNEQFEIGKVYYKDNIEKPKVCSKDGYHYCNKLSDVLTFYNDKSHRYCEIEILGYFTDSPTEGKSVTTTFRILKELSKEEVEKVKSLENEKKYAEKLGLSTVLEIQKANPLIQVGGSIALFLHGIRLKRLEHGSGDIDLIAPYYTKIEYSEELDVDIRTLKDLDDCEDDEDFELLYSNDFDERVYINGFKVDIQINPKNRYEIVEYNGDKYRISTLEHIMESKWRYALKGSLKHKRDCYEISGKTPNKK